MKKNKLISFVLVMFTVSFHSYGQSRLQDVVYLKDGGVMRGVIQQQDDKTVKIEIAGGSVFVIHQNEIDTALKNEKINFDGTRFQQKQSGYFNISQVGCPFGTQAPDYYQSETQLATGFNVQTIHGFRFHSNFLAGAGLGIDLVTHPMLQLFGDARYEILKSRATPYIYGDAGYGFDLAADINNEYQHTEYSGGAFYGTGVGMRFNFRDAGAFMFDMGFRKTSRHELTHYEGYYDLENIFTSNRIVMRMGLAF